MEPDDVTRIIGRLEALTESQAVGLREIIQNQALAAAKAEHHEKDDVGRFGHVAEALGDFRDRMARFELIADTVDSHGDAITSIERRLDVRDQDDVVKTKVAIEVKRANQVWQRGMVAGATMVGAAAGSAGTSAGPKIWKVIAGVLGIK
jgi:hypothetical protein